MKASKHSKLAYLILAVILILSIIICSSVFMIFKAKQNLYNESVQYLTELSAKSADLVRNKVTANFDTINAIALFIQDQKDFDNSMKILKQETGQHAFKRMGIADKTGLANTTDGKIIDISQREYFTLALNGQSPVSNVLIDQVDDKPINVFSVPLYDNNNEINAILFATFSTSELSSLLTVDSFGGAGLSYIIEDNGKIISAPTNNKSDNFINSNLFDHIQRNKNSNNEIIADQNGNLHIQKDNGTFSFNDHGVPKELSYSKIGVNNWYIVSIVPNDKISANSNELIKEMIISVCLITLFLIITALLIIYRFKTNEKKLEYYAFVDKVTGGFNWNMFLIRCADVLEINKDKKYAMLCFDIDKFKIINDIYGHEVGNNLLKHISNTLRTIANKSECYCRISADKYNYLITYNDDKDIISKIKNISSKVCTYLDSYSISLSFGIYKISDELIDPNIISDKANLAKAEIKSNPNTNYAFYNDELRDRILRDKEIENCMELALLKKEFLVYLQPKYRFDTEEIIGAEALVRWNNHSMGMLYPNSFIPLFEKNGYIKQLDYYMFEEVCKLLKKWQHNNKFDHNLIISVNFSRIHLINNRLAEDLLKIANNYKVLPKYIEIELTESVVFENNNNLINIMNMIKQAGFQLSIDDFGSGYSSLNTLKDIPADIIKLDRGFLDEITESDKGKEIIINLVQMTKALSLQTVAEGVETIEQANFLKASGCDIAQGYYYAKPMPVNEFEKLITK